MVLCLHSKLYQHYDRYFIFLPSCSIHVYVLSFIFFISFVTIETSTKKMACFFRLDFMPHQHRSYCNIPASQVMEDLMYPSVHYFRQEWTNKKNNRYSVASLLVSSHEINHVSVGTRTHSGEGQAFLSQGHESLDHGHPLRCSV
jgi:hypothetical protein